ncbi:TUP1-like enhancer of split protein 1 [Macaca mulatta]|uniref:Protein HIRA n=1 Tax=Macaca mulatta TaxID=9544 RepID=G7N385_MACMU|nr:TUP1-like enhancer of split protein 1 [Macaca mulatta]
MECKPIFSVDIHPDGTKFATGGQGQDSGKVVIWNMSPVLQEDDEKDENIPKMLCQMDNHLGITEWPFAGFACWQSAQACVNCVRWSNSGMYLASGGDDKLIMVWKRATYIGPSTVFGSSGKLANVEQWRCVSILRSHSGDVMDVAWSPHDAWLASCSVDNTVVIWNAVKFPEILATLRGHSGLVKGLTWDPVGKYIASQADDRSLKVWRTLDWQLETSITKPFDECGGTTHVLRLSWSPDGHYLVSAHAMNNSGPTAQIIEREGWKTNMDFVGHRKAVTVVKFNPKIFKKKQKNGSSAKPSCPYCCCAVGSKDRSLSVWLTCLKRPLVVIHELFDKSIMDISWTLNGLGILVCSMDGSVAFLDFSQDELGDPLSEEEKSRIHQSTYGKSLAIMTEAQLSTAVIENPEMLKYQRRQQQQQQLDQKSAATREMGSATSVAGVVNGESLEDIRKDQVRPNVWLSSEHTGPVGWGGGGVDGGTLFCGSFQALPVEKGDFSTAFFNSIPLSGSLAGTMLSSHSSPQLLPLDSSTPNSFGASKPCTEPVVAASARPAGDSVNKDRRRKLCDEHLEHNAKNVTLSQGDMGGATQDGGCLTKGKGQEQTMASAPQVQAYLMRLIVEVGKIEPMKAFDSRFTERSKATPGAPALTSVTPTAAERLKEQNLVKELRPRDLLESSSDSDEKVPLAKPSSLSKRKLELEVETVEKKKKGRPRKDSRLMPVSLSVQSPAALTAEKEAMCLSAPALALKLPIPGPQRAFTLQVSSDPSMYIEVENEVTVVGGVKLSRLKCNREGKEWETVLTSRILTAAGSCDVVCVACEKRMLSVFSSCGRRLLSPILLPSPISTLHCTGSYVMALTAAATLSVWDVHRQVVVVKEESLHSILAGSDMTVSQILLTQHGIPVMNLSDGKAYCFNPSLSTWNLVSDKQDSLAQCADFRSSLPSQDAMLCSGPLAIIQGRTSNSGRQAARLFSVPHVVQQETTLAYLENQVAAALTLQSSHEYRHWLLLYARYLVNEGFEYRLREICKDLLGPVHYSTGSQWESTVVGLRKRELLKELLPVIGQNLRFQRLFTECQEQLDILRDK